MNKVRKLVHEINTTFSQLIFFSRILDAFLIFLGAYLVFTFVKLYPLIAIAPAGVYLFYAISRDMKKRHLKDVEDASPNLNEKLRTAVDNMKVKNIFTEELQKEVIEGAKDVKASSFISTKRTTFKMVGVIMLSFLILVVSIADLGLDLNDLVIDTFNKYKFAGGGDNNREGEGDTRQAGGDSSEDIFGEEDVAQLGRNELDAVIKPNSYEISLDDVKDPLNRNFQEAFPREIFTVHSGSFEENIPKEHQEIVKNYFEKLGQG